jgi:Fe-S-cluster containining protein
MRCTMVAMRSKPGVWRDAKIHLEVLGHDRELALRVRTGAARLRDLLPIAAEISRQVTAIAVTDAVAGGAQIPCKVGCAACCRQLVPISAIEARHLADVVDAMPPKRRRAVRRRFAEAVQRMEQIGLLDPADPRGRHALRGTAMAGESSWDNVSRRYFAAQIPCPLLEDESCGVYADRPLICREYHVVTPPALCGEFAGGARTVPRPARMSEALADAANAVAGTDLPSIPLALALEWSEVHGDTLAGQVDGEAMFWALLEHVGSDAPVRG